MLLAGCNRFTGLTVEEVTGGRLTLTPTCVGLVPLSTTSPGTGGRGSSTTGAEEGSCQIYKLYVRITWLEFSHSYGST